MVLISVPFSSNLYDFQDQISHEKWCGIFRRQITIFFLILWLGINIGGSRTAVPPFSPVPGTVEAPMYKRDLTVNA